jgi:phosphate transport system protein
MTTHFEQELEALKRKLLTMGSHAEDAVNRAVKAVVDQNDTLAEQVKRDDDILDQLEMEVDEMGINLLAKAPLATDLRLLAMGMKISHELERVGDAATTIARRALELNREPVLKPEVDLSHMTVIALGMLREALDAFVDRNTAAARAVIPRDKEVDRLNKELHREMVGYIVEKPAAISRCLNLMIVSKSLERIGDHAKNIAEDVVYLYEGQDIRHGGKGPDA